MFQHHPAHLVPAEAAVQELIHQAEEAGNFQLSLLILIPNRMKKIILITGILCALVGYTFAQNEEDVLRYSMIEYSGTARYVGLGGAYGAIGADFSSLSTNPAGIGVYKKSEFTISPGLFFNSSESNFLGTRLDDGKNQFALGNLGLVLVSEVPDRLDKNPIKNYQFGFGINRQKNFNNRVTMQGINSSSSLLDAYLDYAGNKNPNLLNDFDTRPAFDTYLIDTLSGVSPITYINAYDYLGGFTSALQQKTIETTGSMNEFVMSGGLNFNDQIYFGLSLGFPYIRFEQRSTFKEFNQTPERDLDEFTVVENLETRGSGFNLKMGTIVKVLPELRLGAAFHSPTWFNNLTDRWNTTTAAYYTNGDSFVIRSPNGEFSYDIKTPWRFSTSAAYLVNQIGFISAEYEFVDYSTGRLRPSSEFVNQNNTISQSFASTHNFRVGAEVIYGMIQFRGGYMYRMSPFASDLNDASANIFSGGIGMRSKEFFVDAAVSYQTSGMDYYLYNSPNYSAMANLNSNNFNFILTIGYRFD